MKTTQWFSRSMKLRLVTPVLQRGLVEADFRVRRHNAQVQREEFLERWSDLLYEAQSLAELLLRCHARVPPTDCIATVSSTVNITGSPGN